MLESVNVKTDTVPCVQAASPFFITPSAWQSLIIVPQDISLKATQRISECLLLVFGLSL